VDDHRPGQAGDGWLSRLRRRGTERRAVRADRRARRKARIGDDFSSAARQAESSNFERGGYFTTKPHDRP
jgi:hypothetical protein